MHTIEARNLYSPDLRRLLEMLKTRQGNDWPSRNRRSLARTKVAQNDIHTLSKEPNLSIMPILKFHLPESCQSFETSRYLRMHAEITPRKRTMNEEKLVWGLASSDRQTWALASRIQLTICSIEVQGIGQSSVNGQRGGLATMSCPASFRDRMYCVGQSDWEGHNNS